TSGNLPLTPEELARIQCTLSFDNSMLPPTTTTTTTTSPESTTTTTTNPPPQCGNGTIDAGESCDDGNTTFADDCPSDFRLGDILHCTPSPQIQTVAISVNRADLGGIQLILDYPEGEVDLAGFGFDATAAFSGYQGGLTALDFGHAVRVLNAAGFELGTPFISNVEMHTCPGHPLPTAAPYPCIGEIAFDATRSVDLTASTTCSVSVQ